MNTKRLEFFHKVNLFLNASDAGIPPVRGAELKDLWKLVVTDLDKMQELVDLLKLLQKITQEK